MILSNGNRKFEYLEGKQIYSTEKKLVRLQKKHCCILFINCIHMKREDRL